MASAYEVRKNTYFDSVTLMLISSHIGAVDGVEEAAVMMGTDHNKELMIHAGLITPEQAGEFTANDMVIGIRAASEEAVQKALETLQAEFEKKNETAEENAHFTARNLEGAVRSLGSPNMCVVSLPGKYAKREAMKAMKNGMHVLLFSDNVSIDEENELKDYAVEHGMLMMGPDCGTAIINGTALGFANVVRRGRVGIVAAAGTGLQETTVILDRLGSGVSEAIGTGGRDVKEAVGGKMMLLALDALNADAETEVIGIIAKPPHPSVLEKIKEKVAGFRKPIVAALLGAEPGWADGTAIVTADTIEEAAVRMASLDLKKEMPELLGELRGTMPADPAAMAATLKPEQRYVRGLYSGGTLCYESYLILTEKLGPVWSNVGTDPTHALRDVEESTEHTLLDMGDDYFTDGMPHPMIDVRLRSERILKEAMDPGTAVVLLDCVLGYGCHEDPAGALAVSVRKAREQGSNAVFVASVCGTERDEQVRSEQERTLREAGVLVAGDNAQAAELAAAVLCGKRSE